MGYRGDDLDLRTPQGHTPPPADWREADGNGLRGRVHHGGVLNGPIMVDETVLACCNHAYDVALAHGAAEVRLEHFLNALTRIDAAAEALEARGVRVAALRRESATVIASDIPSSSSKTVGSPRRTQELEDVLRLAAAHSGRRNEPATVDDVIHVMLDEEPNMSGLSLLHSVTSGRVSRRPLFGTLPSVTRAVSASEGRNYLSDVPRPNRYRLAAQAGHAENGSNGLSISNSRIEGLEQAIANLVGEFNADRKALATAMQEMQGEALAQREEMLDGFNAIGQAINTQASDAFDLSPINDRVTALGRDTSTKLNTLELLIERLSSRPAVDLGSIQKRLEAIEDIITARTEDHSAEIANRLSSLEDSMARTQVRAGEQHDGVLREIADITGRLDKHRNDVIGSVLTPLMERVERQRSEVAALVQPISDALEKQRGEIANAILTPLSDRIDRLEKLSQSADGHEARTAQALAGVLDRFGKLERDLASWAQATTQTGAAYAKEIGEVEEVLVRLTEGQRTASGALSAWRQEGNNTLSALMSRVDAVEEQGVRANSMLDQLASIVERMHQVTTQRYMKRNRIRYWLFGTDDWVSASWPSQAKRLSEAMSQGRITRS